jgi:hypothetical protein
MFGAPKILAHRVIHVGRIANQQESMLTPPNITLGRTIRRTPAKRRDSWVLATSIAIEDQ